MPVESNKVLDKFKGNKRVLKNEMIHGSWDGTCLMNGSWGKVKAESLWITCFTSKELSLNKCIVSFSLQGRKEFRNQFKIKSSLDLMQTGPHKHMGRGTLIHVFSFHMMTLHHCKQIGKHSCSFQSLNRMQLLLLLQFFPPLISVDELQVSEWCGISKWKHIWIWYWALLDLGPEEPVPGLHL